MDLNTFTDELDRGTVEQIQNTRQNRFTHILLLREVTAPARFTTDGETVNTMKIRTGDPRGESLVTRVVDLFYRKQPGAERRTAKSIQRDLLDDVDTCADDRMHPNDMQQNSVESVLFGSAAGNESISQRSRVYYNSAYSIRAADAALQQNTQNASGDQTRVDAEEGQGTWTPDFVKPGTLFPSVVTLDSATPEEVLFTLATIARTARYGASESRGGNVRNHFLDIYTGRQDGPANLELTRVAASSLASDGDEYTETDLKDTVHGPPIDVEDAADEVRSAHRSLQERRGLQFDRIPGEDVQSVVETLGDDEELETVLERQHEKVEDYVDEFNGE
jgi:CRISPR-associated protein Csc2